MIFRLVLVLAAHLLCAQSLPQDRFRTGMGEFGLRAWSLGRDAGATQMAGASAAAFVTDNFSAGVLVAQGFGPQARSISVTGMGRHYFLPLTRFTPWLEGRVGGLVPLEGAIGATNFAAGVGLRWRPQGRILGHLCLDLQLAGFERWGYDDPSEGTNGTSEWVFQRLPLLPSRFEDGLLRLLPQPSLQILL
ncbi:MAG: hypothetical protein IPN71_18790 [Fibrobacteres bacterium]|nr:hypothetical protein [Fibrobacterota bacterium]